MENLSQPASKANPYYADYAPPPHSESELSLDPLDIPKKDLPYFMALLFSVVQLVAVANIVCLPALEVNFVCGNPNHCQ